jgi:hypothetical protein
VGTCSPDRVSGSQAHERYPGGVNHSKDAELTVANWRERVGTPAAFVARNMPLLISILSLAVAAFSLYFSISTQQVDRIYKEISILPQLGIKLDVENFSLSLDNSGLGPAVIHGVRFGIAGRCYDSNDTKSYQQKFREFTEAVFTYGIYKDTIPHRTKDDKPLVLPVTAHPFGEGTTVRPGEAFPYITVDPRAVKDIFAFERVEVIAIKQQLADAVIKVPLSILYCSLTELFCDVAGTENDMCDLRTHPENH